MSQPCTYRRPDGSFCKRWASAGTSFCSLHHPKPEPELVGNSNGSYGGVDQKLHPFLRLVSPRDAFDLLRESICALRFGQLSPHQAYALAYLLELWLKMRDKIGFYDRRESLRAQMLTELVDNDQAAEEALKEGSQPEPLHPAGSSRPALGVEEEPREQVDVVAAQKHMMDLLGHVPDTGDDLTPRAKKSRASG